LGIPGTGHSGVGIPGTEHFLRDTHMRRVRDLRIPAAMLTN